MHEFLPSFLKQAITCPIFGFRCLFFIKECPMRVIEGVNWYGFYTLTMKEINRFLKVHAQTIGAPVVTALLYYLVFAVALGDHKPAGVGNVSFLQFLAPGLIMMTIAQNAFANTASSLVIAKVQGNIVDVLMPPLSAGELVAGYVLGGVARGLLVGLASAVTMILLVQLPVMHIGAVVFHAIFGGMFLALLGIIGGIWADKFDQLATVQNFIIMPLTFLSGTFFAVTQLPPLWQFICHLNPVFYMIDGFRYGFIGAADASPLLGAMVMLGVNAALVLIAYRMFQSGYKLRA
jgi:ABC-2 type transport system permease protein